MRVPCSLMVEIADDVGWHGLLLFFCCCEVRLPEGGAQTEVDGMATHAERGLCRGCRSRRTTATQPILHHLPVFVSCVLVSVSLLFFTHDNKIGPHVPQRIRCCWSNRRITCTYLYFDKTTCRARAEPFFSGLLRNRDRAPSLRVRIRARNNFSSCQANKPPHHNHSYSPHHHNNNTSITAHAIMPHAKHFKLGLTSCWGCGTNHAAGDGDFLGEEKVAETKKTHESYDFNQHPEHAMWRLATAAAAASKHHPTPGDVLVPWSHHAASESGGTSEVCTLEPAPGAGRATLFLRTTLTAGTLANRLNRDFFKYSKMDVNVSEPASWGGCLCACVLVKHTAAWCRPLLRI